LYLLYLIWILYGITYSEYPLFGFRVLLKYSYPFLILLFASKVVDDDDLFVKIALMVRKIGLASIFLSLIVPFVLLLFPGVLWYGTALAIHYIGLMVLSLAIFDIRRNKWDLIIAILFFIPCLLWVLRTSILGSIVALTVFSLIKYKIRALPVLVFAAGLLFMIVMFTPSVKQKMFNKDIDSKKLTNSQGDMISKDDINSNGRFAMWEWSLENYYAKNQLEGSGSGTLQYVFYQRAAKGIGAGIVHNDYVQILCDSGLIGLVLYLSIFLSLVIHAFFVYNNPSNSNVIRMCAIAAGVSAIGMAATSYTDNTVNYTVATLSYPFGLYGMMLGLLKGQKNKQIEEEYQEYLQNLE
jgi:O-antigen ligase